MYSLSEEERHVASTTNLQVCTLWLTSVPVMFWLRPRVSLMAALFTNPVLY